MIRALLEERKKPHICSKFSPRKRTQRMKVIFAFASGHDSESQKLKNRYWSKMDLSSFGNGSLIYS